MFFIMTLSVLVAFAISIFTRTNKTAPCPKNVQFKRLQTRYLSAYYLATFSDWLQGPYVYKLYSDYGYEEEDIAILYIAGFASSSVCGTFVGFMADRYGRKIMCALFGVIYSLCCLTKISSSFHILLAGRIFGGLSTSILLSTFEAWYVNEHINHCDFPPEWLNVTFSKAGFYTGLLAIIAGVVSQISAENLNLGPMSPFLLAIPFLSLCTYLILTTWSEHKYTRDASNPQILSPLHLIFFKDRALLVLGLVQSLFEAVMYTFIYSWTPIISHLDPPLGLVFACFMISFMIGSKVYALMISKRYEPQNILTMSSGLAFFSLALVGVIITFILYTTETGMIENSHQTILTQICVICFIVYEFCVGIYIPVISYLKGRVVPEEYRASVSNWFRVPMNIFTCFSITLNQYSTYDMSAYSPTVSVLKKFELIYLLCAIFLLITTLASSVFSSQYVAQISRDDDPSCQDIIKVVTMQGIEESIPENESQS